MKLPLFNPPRILQHIPWKGVGAVAVAFFATRLFLAVVLYMSMIELPVWDPNAYWNAVPDNILANGLIRWDSGYYRDLAQSDYTALPNTRYTVFFPLYPLTIRLAALFTGDVHYAGLLVSNLMFLVALGFMYALARTEYDPDTAGRVVFYLAASPPAFFCSAYYTESLFLALLLGAMYYTRRQKWLLAAALGGLASLTRYNGVFIAAYIALEGYWLNGGRFLAAPFSWKTQLALAQNWIQVWLKSWRALLAAAGSALGLLAYMLYLQLNFGDALAFIHNQSGWFREVSANFLWQLYENVRSRFIFKESFWAGKMLDINDMQDIVAVLVFGFLLLVVIARMRPSYTIYALLVFVTPLLTGQVASMRRYVILLIPCYLLLADWGRRTWVDRLILAAFLPLQAYTAILFSHWVFAG